MIKITDLFNNNFTDSIIVLDTNIWLDLYRYPAVNIRKFLVLLSEVSKYIYITKTIAREYDKHYRILKAKNAKTIESAKDDLSKLVSDFEEEIIQKYDYLLKYSFPEFKNEKLIVDNFIKKIIPSHDKSFSSLKDMDRIASSIKEIDRIEDLFNSIKKDNFIDEISIDDLYSLNEYGNSCIKDKKKFPGHKDVLDKTGIIVFNDLIIWTEIKRYCAKQSKNLLFVTNDVKEWEDKKEFPQYLSNEFVNDTKMNVIATNGQVFFDTIMDFFDFDKDDYSLIPTILEFKASEYIKNIYYKIFELFENELCYYPNKYINNLDDYTSVEYCESELNDIKVVDVEYEYGNAVYYLDVIINVIYSLKSYAGRDDETNEVYEIDDGSIEMEMKVGLLLNREVDDLLDAGSNNGDVSIDCAIVDEIKYTHIESESNEDDEIINY